jgi:hypothetical protein
MYTTPIEKYVKNYNSLDKIHTKRIVICIPTTQTNINNITPVIKSLLDQTVRVDLITLFLSDKNYTAPKELKDSVSIVNNGPAVASTILQEGESNTQIIKLDDKTIYGKDFIEQLLETSTQNPDMIIYSNKTNKIDLKHALFNIEFFDEQFLTPPKNISEEKWINRYFKQFPKKNIKYQENYKKNKYM